MDQIRYAQIDPNGLCNAGCWFCPVRYIGNPPEHITQMSPDDFYNIIKQIHDNKGGIVSEHFNGIYTSHYNETLLYRHFEEMLQTLKEFGLGTVILTNGTPLTPDKTEIINKYPETVWGLCINAPVWTSSELFVKRTGMKEHLFDKLIQNVYYAHDNLKNTRIMSVQINGHNHESGAIKGPKFPDISLDELDKEFEHASKLFPKANVFKQPHLIDRVGMIDEYISSEAFVHPEKEVVGCMGNREKEWIHVNANSDLFLCCNDYEMEYKYGNLKQETLKDVWGSPKHQQMVQNSYQNICKSCTSAVYK